MAKENMDEANTTKPFDFVSETYEEIKAKFLKLNDTLTAQKGKYTLDEHTDHIKSLLATHEQQSDGCFVLYCLLFDEIDYFFKAYSFLVLVFKK